MLPRDPCSNAERDRRLTPVEIVELTGLTALWIGPADRPAVFERVDALLGSPAPGEWPRPRLEVLRAAGLLNTDGSRWCLTPEGRARLTRLVRRAAHGDLVGAQGRVALRLSLAARELADTDLRDELTGVLGANIEATCRRLSRLAEMAPLDGIRAALVSEMRAFERIRHEELGRT